MFARVVLQSAWISSSSCTVRRPKSNILISTMAPRAIKISYELKPPSGIDSGDKVTKKTQEFQINVSGDSDKAFYAGLRTALDAARNQVGDELTAWRDIVGKAELNKEPKKGAAEDEEEEDEGEEEA